MPGAGFQCPLHPQAESSSMGCPCSISSGVASRTSRTVMAQEIALPAIGWLRSRVMRLASGVAIWVCESIYSVDRMAFDERPDELADLPLVRTESQIHFVEVDAWSSRSTTKQEDAHDRHDEDRGEPS